MSSRHFAAVVDQALFLFLLTLISEAEAQMRAILRLAVAAASVLTMHADCRYASIECVETFSQSVGSKCVLIEIVTLLLIRGGVNIHGELVSLMASLLLQSGVHSPGRA